MKLQLTITALLLALMSVAQQATYDATLAAKLGGDNNGMKQYVLVILKTGTNTTATKAMTDSLFRGHMNNIDRLAAEKKLILAGPIRKNEKSYRGIFILDVRSIEEANALVNTDPAVKGNLLAAEFYQWFGSAALPMYLEHHDKIIRQQ